MIHGRVEGLQARIDVRFRLAGGDLEIECVVDTGFEGALTLPAAAVAAMRLPFYADFTAKLADHSPVKTKVHTAVIVWDGEETRVAVLALGERPLLGTALLEGFHLGIDFPDGGSVTLEEL